MVELSDRTKSLNQSGSFLQIHLINQLKKHEWKFLSEYPIRISPFLDSPNNNDDIKQKLQKDEPISAAAFVRIVKDSMDKTIVKETSMDIIAGKQTDNQRTCHLCIESKKLNPQFVDWVFFNQTQQYNNLRLLVRSKSDPAIPLVHIPKTTEYPINTNLGICIIPKESFDYPTCDFGVALKNGKIDNAYYKSDKTTVDDSTRQIMEGMYGHVVDTILQYVLRPSSNPYKNTVCFFPIVVTNANLFICKVGANDINSQTGTIDKEPEYQQVDSLIYECPVPSTIRFLSHVPVDSDQNIAIRKWHVLILSPKGFDEFLKKIDNNGSFDLKRIP